MRHRRSWVSHSKRCARAASPAEPSCIRPSVINQQIVLKQRMPAVLTMHCSHQTGCTTHITMSLLLCCPADPLHQAAPTPPASPVLPTKSAQQAPPALTTALTTSHLLRHTTTWRPLCLPGRCSWSTVLPTKPPMHWTAGRLVRLSPGASTGCSVQVSLSNVVCQEAFIVMLVACGCCTALLAFPSAAGAVLTVCSA